MGQSNQVSVMKNKMVPNQRSKWWC